MICSSGFCFATRSDTCHAVDDRPARRRRRTTSLGLRQQRQMLSRVDNVAAHKRAVRRRVVPHRRRHGDRLRNRSRQQHVQQRQVGICRRHCLVGNRRRKVINVVTLLWNVKLRPYRWAPTPTLFPWLPALSNIEPPATDKLDEKIVKHDSWPILPDILSPPLLRLTSRKPLWLDLQPVDIKSRWRHN